MVLSFSKGWLKSKNVGKQRLYRQNAPLHTSRRMVKSHLSTDLKKKYGIRNISVRSGDKIKVMRGKFKGHMGKIEEVNLKTKKISIEGIERTRIDGNKTKIMIDPSNVMITELTLDDKKRAKKLKVRKNDKTAS